MILGISGKKNSGKNTFARIVNTIVSNPHFTDEAVLGFINRHHNNNFIYKYKAFAEKIKVMVSLLTGYSLEELEDREIKESELGKEWWRYRIIRKGYDNFYVSTEEEALEYVAKYTNSRYVLDKLTPRKLFQLLGTECGRNIIHPNCWLNALFSDYNIDTFDKWLITDVRFPNEMDAIQKRDGIVVRIERLGNNIEGHSICSETEDGYCIKEEDNYCLGSCEKEHISETALDDRTDFDYVIQNDGSLLSLVVIARHFIKQFKLLKNEV